MLFEFFGLCCGFPPGDGVFLMVKRICIELAKGTVTARNGENHHSFGLKRVGDAEKQTNTNGALPTAVPLTALTYGIMDGHAA